MEKEEEIIKLQRFGRWSNELIFYRKDVSVMKRLIVSAVSLILIAFLGVATPSIAGATPTQVSQSPGGPPSSQGCGGDVCMFLSSPSGGYVYVQGWPYSTGFYGDFELTGPHGLDRFSSTQSWPAGGGTRARFNNVNAVVGQYCVTGWSGTINEGKACESIE
jgi:hypothetical protein